jgi:hypothetical protein
MRARRSTAPEFKVPLSVLAPASEPADDGLPCAGLPPCAVAARLADTLETEGNIAWFARRLEDPRASALADFAARGPWRAERIVTARGALALEGMLPPHAPPGVCALLAEEAARWARAFAWLAGAPRVKVTLASVASDACRRFHADFVPLRMLCTYVGPGTEFVRDRYVRRGAADECLDIDEANAAIVPDRSHVERCAAGDLLLLKGEAWPGNRGRGAIHRSPPIERERTPRIVMSLDVPNAMLGER